MIRRSIDAQPVDTVGTADYSFAAPVLPDVPPPQIGAACTLDPANLGDADGENGW